mgnify:CR=1 FL=1
MKTLPKKLWHLIEYYTPHGEEIRFAWVWAYGRESAKEFCRDYNAQFNLQFDEVIRIDEHSDVIQLHGAIATVLPM